MQDTKQGIPAQNEPPPGGRIPVRSRRQAMDLSLVLLSQGIETTIDYASEGSGWGLVTETRDYEKAVETLQLYRQENRHWPWRRELAWPRAVFDWGSALWAGLLVFAYWLSTTNSAFRDCGIMDATAVAAGQWWRIFTAMMLHADLAHLATNLSIGIVLFGLTMGRYGTGTGLLAAFLAGAGGNVASLLINARPFDGLGASGMVMGALGLLSARSFLPSRLRNQPFKHTLAGVVAGVMLFALYGVAPGTDVPAHLGGFVSGFALGTILAHAPVSLARSSKVNLVSGFLLVGLVVGTWVLALKRAW